MRGSPCTPALNRREFLRIGIAGAGLSAMKRCLSAGEVQEGTQRKLKPIIGVFLDGGITHLDSFDFKPGAPSQIRGTTEGIRTKTGTLFGYTFPKLAALSDQFTVLNALRTLSAAHGEALRQALEMRDGKKLPLHIAELHRKEDQHFRGIPYLLADSPYAFAFDNQRHHIGAVRALELTWDSTQKTFLPPPLEKPPNVDARKKLRRIVDGLNTSQKVLEDWEEDCAIAYDLMEQNRPLFTDPSPQEVERYGNNPTGHGIRIASHLAQTGKVGTILVRTDQWDFHEGLFGAMQSASPELDRAVSALIEDLHRDVDAVFWMKGEFGRTPQINRQGGRDHWPQVHSGIVAGGHIQEGIVYGKSDSLGRFPIDGDVTNEAFAKLVLEAAGAPPDSTNPLPPIFKKGKG